MENTTVYASMDKEENEGKDITIQVPPLAPPHNLNDPPVENFTLAEFRASMQLLAQSLMEQTYRNVVVLVNPIREMCDSRVRYF